MASITIRQLDESTKARLRIRAAQRGHSMEEEAREIFKSALTTEESGQPHLVESIRRRVKAGGIAWLAKLTSVRLFTTS
jgi:plasmid stability protein